MAGTYETLLVATDGSDDADRAVEHAIDLAEHYDAEVHALFVVDTGRYGEPALSSAELVVDEIEAEGRDVLEDVTERGRREGVEVTTRSRHGNPTDVILDYADEVDADLVVVGRRGQTHEQHVGSVAERVARSSERAVLVA